MYSAKHDGWLLLCAPCRPPFARNKLHIWWGNACHKHNDAVISTFTISLTNVIINFQQISGFKRWWNYYLRCDTMSVLIKRAAGVAKAFWWWKSSEYLAELLQIAINKKYTTLESCHLEPHSKFLPKAFGLIMMRRQKSCRGLFSIIIINTQIDDILLRVCNAIRYLR